MIYNNVVNLIYLGTHVGIIFEDGSTLQVKYKDLEYPYFYADKSLYGRNIISSAPQKINILSLDGFKEMDMYKIEVDNPMIIRSLAGNCKISAEGSVPYLERRLGADGIIKFVSAPSKYIFYDVEKTKKKFMIGAIVVINGKELEYQKFDSVQEFLKYIYENQIPINLAWNASGYDIDRIEERLDKVDLKYREYWAYTCKLDFMLLYSMYLQTRNLTLEQAAKKLKLGGKLKLDKSIYDMTDKELVEYNKQDVKLLVQIDDKAQLVRLNFEAANRFGVIPNKISALPMTDNLMIMKVREKYNAYLQDAKNKLEITHSGAIIKRPESKIYKNVAELDVNSLYPNVIINIEYNGVGKEVWKIIKELVSEFITMRIRYKKEYEKSKDIALKIKQQMFKIFPNSVYGVLSNSMWRYVNMEMGEFVVLEARKILMSIKDIIEKLGFAVIYMDTDSVFIENVNTKEQAEKLATVVNKKIVPFEVKLDQYFKTLAFFKKADNTGAAKKKYAGKTADEELVVRGLEMVRKDWCEYVREVQERVLNLILDGGTREDIEKYFSDISKGLRSVDIRKLLFVKSMKLGEKYKIKTRQVKALQQLGDKVEGNLVFVSYFMSFNGEPKAVPEGESLEDYRKFIDYDWYEKKQIMAIKGRMISVFPDNRQTKLGFSTSL